MTALAAAHAVSQQPVEPVISEHLLTVLLVAAVLGMATVCLLVALFHMFRAVWAPYAGRAGRGGGRR